MKEIFKNIQGYENLYQISSNGRVKSLNYNHTGKERILKPAKYNCGYLMVGLWKQGKSKRYLVHRLVALHFIPNPNNLPQVNHKDEDKTNNQVNNLEWCDSLYNINYGTRNQRVVESLSKKVLCVETGKIYPSISEVQREFGFSKGNISKCCNGKLKQMYGFHWRYVN